MLKHTLALAIVSAAASSVATAGVLTQNVQFDYHPTEGTIDLVINGFDTQGGTRQLTGVSFEFNHTFAADIFIESTGPTPLSSKDFGASIGFISIYQLGTVEKGGGEELGGDGPSGPPFFGPGGFFLGDLTADLGAYDGVPGNDGPDSHRQPFFDAFTVVQDYGPKEQFLLDALTDVGPLTTVFGGFLEFGFYWNNDPGWPLPEEFFPTYPDDAAVWVGLQDFRHFGDFTVSYEYTNVPTPSAALPLALLGLYVKRRRR